MNRWALPALLVAGMLAMASPAADAAGLTTKVTLNARGQGEVFVISEVTLDEAKRLEAVADPRLKGSFLLRQMLAPPGEVQRLFSERGFSEVAVSQYTKDKLRTEVTAHIGDVRPLLTTGGELSFSEKPGRFLELNGSVGGAFAGQDVDLSPLKDVRVKLWIDLPGTLRGETDKSAVVSHVADSVTYRWTADKLLGEATRIHVRVVPNMEGTPFFWLALIGVVTVLVVLGAFIVLRHGRDAGVTSAR